MYVREISWRDPLVAFAPFSQVDGAVLLDSAAESVEQGRWTLISAFPRIVYIDPPDPFETLDHVVRALPRMPLTPLTPLSEEDAPPFFGGVMGWFGYEANRHLEKLPEPRLSDMDVAEVAFGVYGAALAFDCVNVRAFLVWLSDGSVDAQRLFESIGAISLAPPFCPPISMVPECSDKDAAEAIENVIRLIHAGDIFQTNWTRRFLGKVAPNFPLFDLYRRQRALSSAPFAAFVCFDGAALLSASPERFLFLDVQGRVESRPIKGTRKRGVTEEEDRCLLSELVTSEKDRAENLMIVDLMRNDLSRVCTPGTVHVPVLNRPETFATVHHLVSVVQGQLREGETAVSLLRATFPCGSITGAPKIRAMEVIHALEPARRGPYTGSIFWIGANGAMDSSVIIRTLVVGRCGTIVAQAGGGIVADSDPQDEVEEGHTKVRSLLAACQSSL